MALARVADTSWLYAIFNHQDVFHPRAQTLLGEPRPTLVAKATMLEILDLVTYRVGKQAALEVDRALRSFPHFDLWYPVDEEAALRVWQEHPTLSLADAHAVALADRTGFGLVTFDKQQALAAGAEAFGPDPEGAPSAS